MAIHNTSSDAANTAVRAFLTKVGEFYLGGSFNLGAGAGRRLWQTIRDEEFNGACAYCERASETLQVEHLVMFNRTGYGIHHPGNTVPSCKDCNTRGKRPDGSYLSWDEHLADICARAQVPMGTFEARRTKILSHMSIGPHKLPQLTEVELHAIRVIAASLYENVKTESEKSLSLYKDLHAAFVIDSAEQP